MHVSSSDAKMGHSTHRRRALSVGPGSLLGTDRLTCRHRLQSNTAERELGSSGDPVQRACTSLHGAQAQSLVREWRLWAVKIIL